MLYPEITAVAALFPANPRLSGRHTGGCQDKGQVQQEISGPPGLHEGASRPQGYGEKHDQFIYYDKKMKIKIPVHHTAVK